MDDPREFQLTAAMRYCFCSGCGCLFFYPSNFANNAEKREGDIYCPNGCRQKINPLPDAAALMQLQADFDVYKKRRELEAGECRQSKIDFGRELAAKTAEIARLESILALNAEAAAQAEIAAVARTSKRYTKRIQRLQGEINAHKRNAIAGRCPVCGQAFHCVAEHLKRAHPIYCKNVPSKK